MAFTISTRIGVSLIHGRAQYMAAPAIDEHIARGLISNKQRSIIFASSASRRFSK